MDDITSGKKSGGGYGVVRMGEACFTNWYGSLGAVLDMRNKDNVSIELIFGCLFDETLQFLIDSKDKTYSEISVDSRSWCRYQDATYFYFDASGKLQKHLAGSSVDFYTGACETAMANNIYDIGGFRPTATMETGFNSWSVLRYCRGAKWNSSGVYGVASHRETRPSSWTEGNQARAFMYIR